MSRALLLLSWLLILAWATPAQSQVRRCVDVRGVAIYTDRSCESMQAAPREAPPDPSAGANITSGFAVRGCARRPETLLAGVRGALEARDVNRLANWYHWTGTGSGAAKSLMDELEAIANRPLVSAELLYPAAGNGVRFTSPSGPPSDGSPGEVNLTPFSPAQALEPAPAPATDPGQPPAFDRAVVAGDAAAAPAEPAVPPDALLVQQMRGTADIEAVSVRFALRQNAGCWWIEL